MRSGGLRSWLLPEICSAVTHPDEYTVTAQSIHHGVVKEQGFQRASCSEPAGRRSGAQAVS